MRNGQHSKKSSQRGYGLVLMMLFVATTVMVMLSMQMTTHVSLGQLMTATSPANWTYTASVTAPSDPSNLNSSGVIVGSFTATITQWGVGGWYVVKSVGTAGGSTATISDLMGIQPSYSCSVQGKATEDAILRGEIVFLSNSELFQYAQHNCMIKTPPAGIAAYAVTPATSSDYCSPSGHPPTALTGSGP